MKLTIKLLKEMIRKELKEGMFHDRNQTSADVELAMSDAQRVENLSDEDVLEIYMTHEDNIKAADDIYWENESIDDARSFLMQNKIKEASLIAELIALGKFDDLS